MRSTSATSSVSRALLLVALFSLGLFASGTPASAGYMSKYYKKLKVDDETADAIREADRRGGLFAHGQFDELITTLERELKDAYDDVDPIRELLVLHELSVLFHTYRPDVDRAARVDGALERLLRETEGREWKTDAPYLGLPTAFHQRTLFNADHPEYIERFRHVDRADVLDALNRARDRAQSSETANYIPGQHPRSAEDTQKLEDAVSVLEAALERNLDGSTRNTYLAKLAYVQLRLGHPRARSSYERFRRSARDFDPRQMVGGEAVPVERRHLLYMSEANFAKLLGAAAGSYETAGSVQEAEETYLELAELLEGIRITTASEDRRVQLFGELELLYDRLVRLMVRADKPTRALAYAERAKSRTLMEVLSEGLPEDVEKRLRGARSAFRTASTGGGEKDTALRGSRGLEIVADKVDQDTRVLLDIGQHPRTFPKFDAAAEEIVVEYYVADDMLVRWVINESGQVEMVVRGMTSDRLARLVAGVREQVHDPQSAPGGADAEELGVTLLGGLPRDVGQWTFILDGPLHSLPLSVLKVPEGDFLGLERAYAIAPSYGIYELLKTRGSADLGGRTLVVANPRFAQADLPQLPGAEEEGREVAQMLDSVLLVGDDATETRVRREAERAAVLHFATHGLFEGDDPRNSWLAFSPGGGDDGFLTTIEAMGLDLSDGAIVVLSACETGRVAVRRGDELFGMRRAFLVAGAGTLVTSHWPVDDEATRSLMAAWYGALLAGEAPAAAALSARRTLSAAGLGPADWAAWEVTAAR